MFLILIRYTQPLAKIDLHLEAHRSFLARNFANGNFLLSGRKHPRTGGFILAQADSRGDLENLIEADPFFVHELAEYSLIEVHPSMACEQLAFLLPTDTPTQERQNR